MKINLIPILGTLFLIQNAHAQYINASPNPAEVPAGASKATINITWGSSYSTTCVWWAVGNVVGQQNNQNPHYCGGVSGSTQYLMSPGTYSFWIGNQNSVTVWDRQIVTVNATTAPTIVASPNPVPPPGNFSYPVKALGYSQVSVYGSTSSTGPYTCLGVAAPPVTGSGNVSSGGLVYLYLIGGAICPSGNVSVLPIPQLAVVLVRGQ